MTNRIKVGIVGLGRIGKIHLENLLSEGHDVEVAAAADINEDNLDWARKKGVKVCSTSSEAVMSHDGLDAVIICAPTSVHFELIEVACARRLDIFCEKPLETDLNKIKQIGQMVERSGVRLQVGFQRRFDPNFQKIRAAVKDGLLGEIHLVKITSRDPEPPPIEFVRTSGGLFMDMTIHDFDMARFILGREMEEVFVMADVRVDRAIGEAGDVDTAMMTLRFDDRTLVTIDNSRRAVYGYDQRVEVFGAKGMIQSLNKKPDDHIFYDAQGYHGSAPYYFFLERYQAAYRAELNAFIEAIRHSRPMPAGIHDAYMATAMALATKKSLATGKSVKMTEIIA